jgi:hypothetical protein
MSRKSSCSFLFLLLLPSLLLSLALSLPLRIPFLPFRRPTSFRSVHPSVPFPPHFAPQSNLPVCRWEGPLCRPHCFFAFRLSPLRLLLFPCFCSRLLPLRCRSLLLVLFLFFPIFYLPPVLPGLLCCFTFQSCARLPLVLFFLLFFPFYAFLPL